MTRLAWLSTVVVALGCSQPGDRAQNGCPQGETCSSLTPNGLYFEGELFADGLLDATPKTVMRGGRQTIKATTGANLGAPAYPRPFDAVSSSTTSFTIAGTSPPYATVEGVAPGTGWLRLLEPGTNLLLDRTEIVVKDLARVTLAPRNLSDARVSDATDSLPWGVTPDVDTVLIARLYASDADRLVDTTNVFAIAGGLQVTERWDVVRARATSTSPVVSFAGFDVPLALAPPVDTIVPTDDRPVPGSTNLVVGASATYCFRAMGGAMVNASAAWSFSGTNLSTTPSIVYDNCVSVSATTPGTGTLRVFADGISTTYDLTVVAAKTPPAIDATPVGDAMPGERALLVAGGE